MRGMIPRAMGQVGKYKSKLETQGCEYEMQVSFLEIYNEQHRGLLREIIGTKRLAASDRDSRASTRPWAATAAAHAAEQLEEAKRAAVTLRQQVQHQAEIIERLRESVPQERDDDAEAIATAAAAEAAAGVSYAVKEAEAAMEATQDEADDLRDRLAEAEWDSCSGWSGAALYQGDGEGWLRVVPGVVAGAG
eukprot:g15653.t1